MKLAKKIISVFIFLFFMATTVLADVVFLKSGREINGEITEQTDDYVKINFKGVNLTFYMDEVERVSGGKAEVKEEKKEKDPFREWSDEREDYLKMMMEVQQEATILGEAKNNKLALLRNGQDGERKNVLIDAGRKLSIILQKIKDIDPPEDLKGHYQSLLKVFEQIKKANDYLLAGDISDSKVSEGLSRQYALEAQQEFRSVAGRHNAFEAQKAHEEMKGITKRMAMGENVNIDEGVSSFEKATEVDPQNDQAWSGLGGMHMEKKNYEKASLCFQKAVEINSSNETARFGLALAYATMGKKDEAKKELKFILKNSSNEGLKRAVREALKNFN